MQCKCVSTAEIDAAEWVKDYRRRIANPKPIMALVGGLEAPSGRIMGHAGAWTAPDEPDARAKYKALQDAGAVMVNHPEKFGEGMKALLSNTAVRPGVASGSTGAGQKRGFHTKRQVRPGLSDKHMILNTIPRRSLYIKQHQAFDILKGESVAVREAGASDGDFSLSISVDRSALSPCITVSPTVDAGTSLPLSCKFPFSYTNPDFSRDGSLISSVTSHLKLPEEARGGLQKLVEKLWRIFKEKEAFILETRTILTPSSGRQEEIHKLRNKAEEVPEELEAEKDGIVYMKLQGEGSVGTLVNGAGLAMNTAANLSHEHSDYPPNLAIAFLRIPQIFLLLPLRRALDDSVSELYREHGTDIVVVIFHISTLEGRVLEKRWW